MMEGNMPGGGECNELHELNNQAEKVLNLFNSLPPPEQLNGLDVLQRVVNSAMNKITSGRVSCVKFVPVETSRGTDLSAETNLVQTDIIVKSEPLEIQEKTICPPEISNALYSFPDGSYAYMSGSQVLSNTTPNSIQPPRKMKTVKKQSKPSNQKKTKPVQKKVAQATKSATGKKRTTQKQKNNLVKEDKKLKSPVKKKQPAKILKIKIGVKSRVTSATTKKKTSGVKKTKKKPDVDHEEPSIEDDWEDIVGPDTDASTCNMTNVGVLEEPGEEEKKELMLKLIPPEMRMKATKKKKVPTATLR